MYPLKLEGPWDESKIADNAQICFAIAHQRYGISVPTLFREYLRRIEYCERYNDFEALLDVYEELTKQN